MANIPMGFAKKPINDTEASTLANICRVAAERFASNAEEFRKLGEIQTPTEGALFPTGESARRLAEQFDLQARQAQEFATIFDASYGFDIPYEPEDEASAA
jgi:hypothetical protein